MISKLLFSGAIVLSVAIGGSASAMADPANPGPDPFSGVGCADQASPECIRSALVTAPTVSPEQMTAQMQAALAAMQALPQPVPAPGG